MTQNRLGPAEALKKGYASAVFQPNDLPKLQKSSDMAGRHQQPFNLPLLIPSLDVGYVGTLHTAATHAQYSILCDSIDSERDHKSDHISCTLGYR